MKGRRLEPYFHATCNGTDVPPEGCSWRAQGSDRARIREQGESHATAAGHEVVIQNTNDGLVLDGRKDRR